MDSRTLAVLLLLGVAAAYALSVPGVPGEQGAEGGEAWEAEAPQADTGTASFTDEITDMARRAFNYWQPPAQYAPAIAAAEQRYGIPSMMLARLLYQECRWREDIISGRLRSPAGAMGIAQFMPATAAELGIDPLNAAQAIDAAGRYLASLYRRFGTWTQALAAYNWGQGNVARRGVGAAPAETRNYYTDILADVNTATGGAWA